MKQFTLLSLVLLLVVLFTACNKDDETINPQTGLIGSWRLTKLDYTYDNLSARDYFRQLAQKLNPQLTDAQLDQVANEIADALATSVEEQNAEILQDNTVLSFQPEGVLVVSDQGVEEQGSWEVRDNNVLVLDDGSDAIVFTITNLTQSELNLLTEGELNLGPELGDTDVTIGTKLSYIKQ